MSFSLFSTHIQHFISTLITQFCILGISADIKLLEVATHETVCKRETKHRRRRRRTFCIWMFDNPQLKNENCWGSTITHSDHKGERTTSGLRIVFQPRFHVILFVSGGKNHGKDCDLFMSRLKKPSGLPSRIVIESWNTHASFCGRLLLEDQERSEKDRKVYLLHFLRLTLFFFEWKYYLRDTNTHTCICTYMHIDHRTGSRRRQRSNRRLGG